MTEEDVENYNNLYATYLTRQNQISSSNSMDSLYDAVSPSYSILPVSDGEPTTTCNTLKKRKVSVRDYMASFERPRKAIVQDENEQGRAPENCDISVGNNSQGQIKKEMSREDSAPGLFQRWRDLRSNSGTRFSKESQVSQDDNISAIQDDSLGRLESVGGTSPANKRKDEWNKWPLKKKIRIGEEWGFSEAGCKVEELDNMCTSTKDSVRGNSPVKASGTIEGSLHSEDACIEEESNSEKETTGKGTVKEKKILYLMNQPRTVAINSGEKPRRKRINLHKKMSDISTEESDREEEQEERMEGEEGDKEEEHGLVVWPSSACTDGVGDEIDFSKEDIEIVRVPASINARLLPHQRHGVRFLYGLYAEKRGGVLADDMLGLHDLLFQGTWKNYSSDSISRSSPWKS